MEEEDQLHSLLHEQLIALPETEENAPLRSALIKALRGTFRTTSVTAAESQTEERVRARHVSTQTEKAFSTLDLHVPATPQPARKDDQETPLGSHQ